MLPAAYACSWSLGRGLGAWVCVFSCPFSYVVVLFVVALLAVLWVIGIPLGAVFVLWNERRRGRHTHINRGAMDIALNCTESGPCAHAWRPFRWR